MGAVEDYEPAASFDADAAAIYDDEPRGDEQAAVAFLERLAGGGPALELAIGTGRIALPLAARGTRSTASSSRRTWSSSSGPSQAGRTSTSRSATCRRGHRPRPISARLPRLQHALQPAHPGRPGPLLRERRRPPDRRRLRSWSRRSCPTFLYRLRHDQYVDAESVGRRRGVAGRRAPRPGDADPRRVARAADARRRQALPDRDALLLAERAGPDGSDRRAAAEGALGRLER